MITKYKDFISEALQSEIVSKDAKNTKARADLALSRRNQRDAAIKTGNKSIVTKDKDLTKELNDQLLDIENDKLDLEDQIIDMESKQKLDDIDNMSKKLADTQSKLKKLSTQVSTAKQSLGI